MNRKTRVIEMMKKKEQGIAVFQFTPDSFSDAVKTIERAISVLHQASIYASLRTEIRESFESQASALEQLLRDMGHRIRGF